MLDHLRRAWAQLRLPVGFRFGRPDERHGLRHVADVVVGPAEQHRIDALLHEAADHRRLGAGKVEAAGERSEEHTSELQSLMRISYAVFCLKKKNKQKTITAYQSTKI